MRAPTQAALPVDDILQAGLPLGQRQNQVLLTVGGWHVPTRCPGPLPLAAVRNPGPRRLFSADHGTNPQQISAVDGGPRAAPLVDRVDVVQSLLQKSALLLLRGKQRDKRSLRDTASPSPTVSLMHGDPETPPSQYGGTRQKGGGQHTVRL